MTPLFCLQNFGIHHLTHKKSLPCIKKVIHLSDGCGNQYKNCENFLSLRLPQKDFELDAEWVFFATSHGK